MTSTRLAVCPGSFDPLTHGHVDIVTRSAALFDRVIVAVLINAEKQPFLSIDERLAMIREVFAAQPQIDVDTFDGLLADYIRARPGAVVVRGLRTATEFSDEWQMAQVNRQLYSAFETVFLVPGADVAHISSRLVRQIAVMGGPLDGLVPPAVAARLAARRSSAGTRRV
jgi:pantetheine-phosphate adenylyltransferase